MSKANTAIDAKMHNSLSNSSSFVRMSEQASDARAQKSNFNNNCCSTIKTHSG